MTYAETRELAVKTIREEFADAGITIKQIVLFGSRTQGDARPDSDWDFLVCIDKELSFPEKALICTQIQSRLAVKGISVDVIVKSEEKLIKERDNVGVITYYALKNGVRI